jgi:hypothetical protein
MDHLTAINIAEGTIEARSTEEWVAAYQYLIDEGHDGMTKGIKRVCDKLIELGTCTPPRDEEEPFCPHCGAPF